MATLVIYKIYFYVLAQGTHPLHYSQRLRVITFDRRLRSRVKRQAHLLMPPLRCTNCWNGSAWCLIAVAYRMTLDHLLRVRGPQGPASPFHITPFSGPPRHQVVDGTQVRIDRVPSAAALTFGPGVPNPVEVLAQGFPGVWNGLWLGLLFAG
jgi:hypothetical protein